MKKLSLIVTSVAFLAACQGPATETTITTTTSTTQAVSSGQMDPSQITAVQDGKSDAEWNQSRGTVSDGADTNATQAPTRILTPDAKSLIVYFSRSGSTELLASKIQNRTNADALELVVQDHYSADYGETVQRANGERQVANDPVLNVDVPDLSQYDTIYLGYPIWGMTLAEPMASFVEQYSTQLAGKKIVPFSTNGSYGIGSSVTRIERILSDNNVTASITEPYTIQGNRVSQADATLDTWLTTITN